MFSRPSPPACSPSRQRAGMHGLTGWQKPPKSFRQDAALDCEVEKVEREIRKLG